MAPKRARDHTSRNTKTQRRRRPIDTEQLYKCVGKLCGEECDVDMQMVDAPSSSDNQRRPSSKRQEDIQEVASDYEEVYDSKRGTKNGRVVKSKSKKSDEFSMHAGVQKAMRFICDALDFGVQSGFLKPKDSRGKILQVSTELLHQSIGRSKKRQRETNDRHVHDHHKHEHYDDDGGDPDVCPDPKTGTANTTSRANPKRAKKMRKRSMAKSRSRSRGKKLSKRRAERSRNTASGRSENPNPSEVRPDNEAENDEMENKESNTDINHVDNDSDSKAETKSEKSCTSVNCDQSTNEDQNKGVNEHDNSDYDGSDNDDHHNKKN